MEATVEDPHATQAAPPAKMKSSITTMLSDSQYTRSFYNIFAAVPRVARAEAESAPIETLPVPWGADFALQACLIGLWSLVSAYLLATLIVIVVTLADVAGGSCGQPFWKISPDEACSQMFYKALMFGIDRRCYTDKPAAMSQDDFKAVCGKPWSIIGGIISFVLWTCYRVYVNVGHIPVKVHFHDAFFIVETWSGQHFEGTFYADVTAAKLGLTGLKISTDARFELQAGGADDDDGDGDDNCDCDCTGKKKKGKTLKIKGKQELQVIAGNGNQQKSFVAVFSKYLPVIETGSNAGMAAVQQTRTSIMEGRVQQILDARRSDATTYKAVRMPATADLYTTIIVVVLCSLFVLYCSGTFFKFIDWARRNGEKQCVDPKRPGADMCEAKRIFIPIDVPIVNASDYINVVLVILGMIAIPSAYVASMATEYRFHNSGLMQEVLFAGLKKSQTNKMVFPDDIEKMEKINGSLERYVKMDVRTHYLITDFICGGSFSITAKFMRKSLQLTLVDARCAACCGQRQKAVEHEENLSSLLDKFKSGLLTQ